MKNHLFCVGVELRKTAEQASQSLPTSSYAYMNAYVGANDLREALEQVEKQLKQDGYEILFIRGCWVVDSDCDDGFCPTDESTSAAGGDLLFNGQIQYGKLQEWSINNDYEY